jgi:hypothetical protein
MVDILVNFFISILLILIGGGCMKSNRVEEKNVRFFEKKVVIINGERILKLRGLVFHSALVIDKVEFKRTNEDLLILIYLTPAKKGLSGSFDLNIPLLSSDKQILFGSSGIQIWPETSQSFQ